MEFKNINKIKCVLFDFDDTLAIHASHRLFTDDEKIMYRAKILKNEYTWPSASISKHMKLFMDYCKQNNKEMFLISSSPTIEAIGKLNWVEKNYGYKLHNACVNTHEEKVIIAKSISIAYNVNLDEILIVDDLYSVLTDAVELGIEASTPMEIVNFIEDKIKSSN